MSPRDADDIAELRRRLDDLAVAVDLLDAPDAHQPREIVAVTVAISVYPTVAASFYGVQLADVTGTESEGSAATITPRGPKFLALNLGAVIPPPGTQVSLGLKGGYWVFRF